MEALPVFGTGWLVHIFVGGILASPIVYLSRRRVQWRAYELVVFVIPFGIWFVLSGLIGFRSKSFANVLVEPAVFALAVPSAAVVRVLADKWISEQAWFAGLLIAVTIAALVVYFTIPFLPE